MTPYLAALSAALSAGLATALALVRPAVPARVRRARSAADVERARAAQRPVRWLAGLNGVAAAVTQGWAGLRRQDTRRQQRSIEADVPELVDLIALTVAAGLTVPEALAAAAPCAPPSLRGDVDDAVTAIRTGARVEDALTRMGRRWDEPGRPLVHALIDHARYGTPLLPSLERVGLEARTRRRRAAETRARGLPVLLLFPLVLCTLPAFGLLTVAPLVAGTLGSLDGSPLEAPASTAP